GSASFASSVQCTPLKVVSNRLQRVTQWMSTVTSRLGSSSNCSHVSVSGFSTSPDTLRVQVARSRVGTDPAWRRGHFSVRYWPGGRRAGSYPASATLASALDLNRGTLPRLTRVQSVSVSTARRPRSYVRVAGPDAVDYLQRMLSNDVTA